MKIMNELEKPFEISSLNEEIALKHYWVFDAKEKDFFLKEITYLEEYTGPLYRIKMNGTEFLAPPSWNIMITNTETYTVDCVPIYKCCAFDYLVFVFSPNDRKLIVENIEVTEYIKSGTIVYPSLDKHISLINHIGTGFIGDKKINKGILLSPNDIYKFINETTIGEIL